MRAIHVLVFVAGAAALSWEILWQLEASLAIGVSAKGTALVLATTMGGMAVGAAASGRLLGGVRRPLRVYAALEAVVGVLGALVLLPGMRFVESVDSRVGLVVLLGAPAVAMGATIPVLGLVARATRTSLAVLYALNTAGAFAGVLLASFVLLPHLGVELTAIAIGVADLFVAAIAFLSRVDLEGTSPDEAPGGARESSRGAWIAVIASGAIVFALEVAWFRALRAAFFATTQSFAVMLAAVLLALAGGARLALVLERRRLPLGAALAVAGALVLLATPVLERFDKIAASTAEQPAWTRTPVWLLSTLLVVGPAMLLFGTCLPLVLQRNVEPRRWGRVYAVNTIASVAGALAGGFVLLPAMGLVRTSWLLGGLSVVAGVLVLTTSGERGLAAVTGAAALGIAIVSESGIGRERMISNVDDAIARVVAAEEGPDSSVAVVEAKDGTRILLVDGFVASSAADVGTHYMPWMGHLPMVLHPAPRRALVICFGTGQTANAVRIERPEALDVVELSPAVLRMAKHFPDNEGVLDDARVSANVMDGRAWLRRTNRTYDVITLEPMPPNFAGVNALYSREFYELAKARLGDGGIAAQWLPIHILSVHDAAAIAATFQHVFPDSILWMDPLGPTAILAGRRGERRDLGSEWPGLLRPGIERDLTAEIVKSRVLLGPAGMKKYASFGSLITDDNQLLAYGPLRYRYFGTSKDLTEQNLLMLDRMARP